MQWKKSTLLAALTVNVVSGCGSSGGGDGGSGGDFGAVNAMNYAPSFAASETDTVTSAIRSSGATGLAVVYDVVRERVTLQNIRVRQNAAETITYLSINGGAEVALSDGPPFYSDGRTIFAFGLTETDELRDIQTSGVDGLREGYVGIETPLDNLPTGNAIYSGDFSAGIFSLESLNVDSLLGDINITANFDTGDVSGQLIYVLNTIATIEGRTAENGIIGTLTFDDAFEYSGTVPIVGKSFGFDSETMAGVFGSTDITNDTTGEQSLIHGEFNAERVP